jgi:hypothetical protein
METPNTNNGRVLERIMQIFWRRFASVRPGGLDENRCAGGGEMNDGILGILILWLSIVWVPLLVIAVRLGEIRDLLKERENVPNVRLEPK